MQTDWRLISCGDGICNGSETCNTCSSDCGTCQVTAGGNGMLVSLSSSSVPAGKITILVNDGSPKTNNAAVKVTLNGGSGAAQVELSESSVFLEGIPEVYEPVKSFILSSGNGKKTIYARFFYKDGTISSAISSSIILNTQSPEININQLQDSYNSNEDIIISGTVSEPSEITFYWDNQYGLTNSDSNGRWTVNLGKIQPGINSVSITAKDEVGNSKTITIKIKVIATEVVNPKKTSQTIDDLTKQFWSALSNVASQKIITSKLVTVSKETPEVLKHKWNLLPVKAQK
ncbi:MAG: hypothetical protein NTY04_03855 [Candidatus Staskawiczbacteria bacterium]|nr:hypothetical protein [Candidatus Staskawiczbacteria bacterium]